MFLLPRRLVSRDEGGDVSEVDIRPHGLRGSNLSQAQPDNDLHLRVWGRNRQHGARAKHVGAGKGQNGKRAIADAVQGCVPVSPCVHSAPSWNSHKDQVVRGGLRFDETPLSVMEDAFPELRDND